MPWSWLVFAVVMMLPALAHCIFKAPSGFAMYHPSLVPLKFACGASISLGVCAFLFVLRWLLCPACIKLHALEYPGFPALEQVLSDSHHELPRPVWPYLSQPPCFGMTCIFAIVVVTIRSALQHCIFKAFPDSHHACPSLVPKSHACVMGNMYA